ncbi:MAG: hypothetical protein BWY75_02721 [bacterium ADurb.Bin425]|nr:MAG: hypothetical protein BWY75_02721 [bacterium ADurb.Bin425]
MMVPPPLDVLLALAFWLLPALEVLAPILVTAEPLPEALAEPLPVTAAPEPEALAEPLPVTADPEPEALAEPLLVTAAPAPGAAPAAPKVCKVKLKARGTNQTALISLFN